MCVFIFVAGFFFKTKWYIQGKMSTAWAKHLGMLFFNPAVLLVWIFHQSCDFFVSLFHIPNGRRHGTRKSIDFCGTVYLMGHCLEILKNTECGAKRPRVVNLFIMVLLPDTWNCGLRMRRECRERFPHYRLKRKPLVSDPGMHHDTCVTL